MSTSCGSGLEYVTARVAAFHAHMDDQVHLERLVRDKTGGLENSRVSRQDFLQHVDHPQIDAGDAVRVLDDINSWLARTCDLDWQDIANLSRRVEIGSLDADPAGGWSASLGVTIPHCMVRERGLTVPPVTTMLNSILSAIMLSLLWETQVRRVNVGKTSEKDVCCGQNAERGTPSPSTRERQTVQSLA